MYSTLGRILWELDMRTEKSISVETLHRLWSEITLLRQEIEQAERHQSSKLVRFNSAIATAKDRLQSHSDRYR
jgi:uncharacterized protein YaaN involved in tellurite resistance